MKKYHLYLWIVALVGLMTSCSQDETDALPTDTNANRVTLTASLPADFAQPQPQSRALPAAPANHKLRCILEVWDTETTPALKIRKEICPAVGDTEIDFSFDLATAGTYKALLWADYIPTSQGTTSQEIAGLTGVDSYGDNYYITTNGLKEVEISINIPQKPEVVDAFFASKEFTKGDQALTLSTFSLTRPFMKLTIAEKNADRFASCERVTVEFSSPSKFDVATGTVIGTKSRNIVAANEFLNYGNDITIGGQTCKTLICLYVLANAADATMGDIKLEFTSSEQGKSLPTVTIPAGIPLKRNYRVNAAGNLIGEPSSSTVNMTVDINSDWTKPDVDYDTEITPARNILDPKRTDGTSDDPKDYHYTIDTPEELAALSTLANAGAVITGCTTAKYGYANYKLSQNIDLQNKPWMPIDHFYGTFDGQGNTISNMKVSIQSTSAIKGGLFGYIGSDGTVSNLIVEGAVTVENAGSCRAGGICGLLAGTIEFCRFNGTVSSTNTDNNSKNYAGGITGYYIGIISTITGCIANAKVTVSGGKANESGAGGLAGGFYGPDCTYSAWNSGSSEGTSAMIGKNLDNGNSQGTGNNSFSTIDGLNALLNDINSGVPTSTYIWQAGGDSNTYPKLVPRSSSGN